MIMFRHLCFILILLISGINPALSQDNREKNIPNFKDRLIFGGGVGLQFGDYTLIDLSPTVGYRLTPKLETGIGVTYKYFRIKNYFYNYNTGQKFDLKSNIFGGSLYTRYHIFENVFAHVEYERLIYHYNKISFAGGGVSKERSEAVINSFFIGGGYRQRIAGRSYFYIMGLWNLIDDSLSPYSNPVLRMGVALGL